MFEVKDLIQRLSKFYWSPNPPETYVIPTLDGQGGLGLIAHENYAAFNLAWKAYQRQLNTQEGQEKALRAFYYIKQAITDVEVEGSDLESFITLMTAAEFKRWYPTVRDSLPKGAQDWLDAILKFKVADV